MNQQKHNRWIFSEFMKTARWQQYYVGFFILICLGVLWESLSYAQGFDGFGTAESPLDPQKLLSLEAELEPKALRAGEFGRIVWKTEVSSPWHVYSVVPSTQEFAPPPTKIRFNPHPLRMFGPVYEDNPITAYDPVIKMVLSYHKDTSRFYQSFQVPEDLKQGFYKVSGSFRYQVCNEDICTPPTQKEWKISILIEPGDAREAYLQVDRSIDQTPDGFSYLDAPANLEEALAGGIWGFIALAIVMGMLAWLTPCVFPMIPITISFFSKQAHGSYSQTVKKAFLFSSGIVVTYTATGLLLTSFLGAAGVSLIASNPWVNLFIAGLFVVFGLSLMGLFDLTLPAAWTQKLDRMSQSKGETLGMLLMGVTFTLTAFSCTVQFVGTLLLAASQGEWLWPVIGMLVFASTFAFPFFLLALFPRTLYHLQGKSGSWMTQVKVVLGIIEIMAALKFLSNADLVWQWGWIDREWILMAWAVLSVCIALVILGLLWFPKPQLRKPGISWVFAAAFLHAALYLWEGSQGQRLSPWLESYLPPSLSQGTNETLDKARLQKVHALPWHPQFATALEEAKRLNKPIFIDFTGYTCVNCRWMEYNVFAEDQITEQLRSKFVLAQLYTDGGPFQAENQNLQIERFQTIALPYYVILSPDNDVLAKTAGLQSIEKFQRFLNHINP